MAERTGGAWVAYHSDWSGFAVFGEELAALRYAVENSMSVAWVNYGESVREAVSRG